MENKKEGVSKNKKEGVSKNKKGGLSKNKKGVMGEYISTCCQRPIQHNLSCPTTCIFADDFSTRYNVHVGQNSTSNAYACAKAASTPQCHFAWKHCWLKPRVIPQVCKHVEYICSVSRRVNFKPGALWIINYYVGKVRMRKRFYRKAMPPCYNVCKPAVFSGLHMRMKQTAVSLQRKWKNYNFTQQTAGKYG